MRRKDTIIILILGFLLAFSAYSQPQKRIYITLDTSGSMYGDKYMISNYTAQLITLLGRNDDVYLICNGLIKKISGTPYAYQQIQFDYSLIRARWGVSPLGTQIGDIAAFNNEYHFTQGIEQWLFIIGDGNWESYKYTAVTDGFSTIQKQGKLKTFFIPYGNITDGHSDFVDYLRSLKTPKILNESRDLRSVMSNCVNIFSYLIGTSTRNIQLSYEDNKTIRVISPLTVGKYLLFYQDEKDEKEMVKPLSATQDSARFNLNFIGSPSTASLRYKDNQTLITAVLWEIKGEKIESDVPLKISFNKPVDIKKIKLFPVYDLDMNAKINLIATQTSVNEGNASYHTTFNSTTVQNQSFAAGSDSTKQNRMRHEKLNVKKQNEPVLQSGDIENIVHLQKHRNKDSVLIYQASVKTSEKMDTAKYSINIIHNKQLLFKKTTVTVDSNRITFTLEPRGEWSEKFIPDTLSLRAKITLKNKNKALVAETNSTTYKLKAATTTNGKSSPRNKNKLLLLGGIGLLLIYFFFLSRKSRFKKGALVDYFYTFNSDQTVLRKKGIAPWLHRWLNPFTAEKREVNFYGVSKTITFTANRTPYSIRLLTSEFDSKVMTYKEYSENNSRYIEFVENRELIMKHPVEKHSVVIKYDSVPKTKDDRPVFRAFLFGVSVLMVLFLMAI